MKEQHTYTGLWITKDGFICHELLPNGRYDEARGTKPNAYQGDYDIRENRIYYQDDTGFTADGTFVSNDELHHASMVFFRHK